MFPQKENPTVIRAVGLMHTSSFSQSIVLTDQVNTEEIILKRMSNVKAVEELFSHPLQSSMIARVQTIPFFGVRDTSPISRHLL
jgi:hypothetical protein